MVGTKLPFKTIGCCYLEDFVRHNNIYQQPIRRVKKKEKEDEGEVVGKDGKVVKKTKEEEAKRDRKQKAHIAIPQESAFHDVNAISNRDANYYPNTTNSLPPPAPLTVYFEGPYIRPAFDIDYELNVDGGTLEENVAVRFFHGDRSKNAMFKINDDSTISPAGVKEDVSSYYDNDVGPLDVQKPSFRKYYEKEEKAFEAVGNVLILEKEMFRRVNDFTDNVDDLITELTAEDRHLDAILNDEDEKLSNDETRHSYMAAMKKSMQSATQSAAANVRGLFNKLQMVGKLKDFTISKLYSELEDHLYDKKEKNADVQFEADKQHLKSALKIWYNGGVRSFFTVLSAKQKEVLKKVAVKMSKDLTKEGIKGKLSMSSVKNELLASFKAEKKGSVANLLKSASTASLGSDLGGGGNTADALGASTGSAGHTHHRDEHHLLSSGNVKGPKSSAEDHFRAWHGVMKTQKPSILADDSLVLGFVPNAYASGKGLFDGNDVYNSLQLVKRGSGNEIFFDLDPIYDMGCFSNLWGMQRKLIPRKCLRLPDLDEALVREQRAIMDEGANLGKKLAAMEQEIKELLEKAKEDHEDAAEDTEKQATTTCKKSVTSNKNLFFKPNSFKT